MFSHYLRRFFELPFREALAKTLRFLVRKAAGLFWNVRSRVIGSYGRQVPDTLINKISLTSQGTFPPQGIFSLSAVENHTSMLLVPEPVSHAREHFVNVNLRNRFESGRIRRLIAEGYKPVDWQADPVSGYRWACRRWHTRIVYGRTHGVDVKLPWEFARGHHLLGLALDEPASRDVWHCFKNEVLDFIAHNPPGFGVNWACPMDVGIRASNWSMAWDVLADVEAEDTDFHWIFRRSILEHGRFLVRNLEWNAQLRGNHYLVNVCALVVLSAYLPRSEETDGWLAFAISQLLYEFGLQFYEDGTNFEASTSYHVLSLEAVVVATAVVLGLPEERLRALSLIDRTHPVSEAVHTANVDCWLYGDRLPDEFVCRVSKAIGFLSTCFYSDGTRVNIGDNDSGGFISPQTAGERVPAERDRSRDYATLFEGARARSRIGCLLEGLAGGRKLSCSEPDSLHLYERFGLWNPQTEHVRLWLRCGSVGQNGVGGHAHNDQLSVLAEFAGKPFLVDPGSLTYTRDGELRNLDRSTGVHNTLQVDQAEQNIWLEGWEGFFNLRETCTPSILDVSPRRIVGRVDYANGRTWHKREVEIDADGRGFSVRDAFSGNAEACLQLHPDVSVHAFDDGVYLENSGTRVKLSGAALPSVCSGRFSPRYGCALDNTSLRWTDLEDTFSWSVRLL